MKFVAIPQMLSGIFLYGIHFLLKKCVPMYNYTPFRWYFSDIFALIVSIPFFVNLQIIFIKRKCYFISFVEILFWFAVFSVYYEIIMPQKIDTITGDPLDIVAYGLGGTLLYLSQDLNKKNLQGAKYD
jgi:hypothetical protein